MSEEFLYFDNDHFVEWYTGVGLTGVRFLIVIGGSHHG